MAFKPVFPETLQFIPSEQEEVNGQNVTLPEVINLVSEDDEEEEIDENDFEEPSSNHHKDNDDKDDDDAPALGTGGIIQGNNASAAAKLTEKTIETSPPPSPQKSSYPSPQQHNTTAKVVELSDDNSQKITDAQAVVAQLKDLLEEEQQLHLQLEEKITESRVKLDKLEEQTRKDTQAYSEIEGLRKVVDYIAKELDAEKVSGDKHDDKAASSQKEVPSSKGKKPISEMVAAFKDLDAETQEDEDHWADDSDDEEDKALAEHHNEHLAVSHLKRKLIAPEIFTKLPDVHSQEYMNRYQVLENLKKELSSQNKEVIASVPLDMKKFSTLR